jgi:predicted nucleic acid-binding protein
VIVADVAVLACALVDAGPDGAAARKRLTTGAQVVVPEGTDAAVCAVLARLVEAGRITERRAEQAVADLRDLPLDRVPQAPFLARAWALRAQLTAAQAITGAVAEAYGVQLVTAEPAYARADGLDCRVELV